MTAIPEDFDYEGGAHGDDEPPAEYHDAMTAADDQLLSPARIFAALVPKLENADDFVAFQGVDYWMRQLEEQLKSQYQRQMAPVKVWEQWSKSLYEKAAAVIEKFGAKVSKKSTNSKLATILGRAFTRGKTKPRVEVVNDGEAVSELLSWIKKMGGRMTGEISVSAALEPKGYALDNGLIEQRLHVTEKGREELLKLVEAEAREPRGCRFHAERPIIVHNYDKDVGMIDLKRLAWARVRAEQHKQLGIELSNLARNWEGGVYTPPPESKQTNPDDPSIYDDIPY